MIVFAVRFFFKNARVWRSVNFTADRPRKFLNDSKLVMLTNNFGNGSRNPLRQYPR